MALGGFGGADPQTIFQIGSVTNVFTALLLADMAERGEVELSGQAAAYLRRSQFPRRLATGWRRDTGMVAPSRSGT